ncbi:MAG: ferritin family protein [Candidatus Aminicenantes bacterium]|nr:ferritin family protein [Candidatus Aminicenantes bacterium]MBL7081999.1 ferritin family protein [Candidatus Aminicenantes bacterium]
MKLSNFGDVINFAIKREEEAIQVYGNLIDLAKNPGVKKLLQELQEEEKNHKKLLQNITKEKIESLAITDVIDLKISDYLVEEPPSEDMNFQDLLILAAKKEQQAVELYSNLANKSKEGDLKKLFEFLIEQEKSHKLKLETEYDSHILEWN